MYYHGESINVNVQATNNSNKTVKKIRITVIQSAEIMLYSTTQYKCEVAELESTCVHFLSLFIRHEMTIIVN